MHPQNKQESEWKRLWDEAQPNFFQSTTISIGLTQPTKKLFTVAYVMDLEKQVANGDISYSRMIEIMNERANSGHVNKTGKSVHDLETCTEKEEIKENIMNKTGIELIAQERNEQIEKHGFSVVQDADYYQRNELVQAALFAIDTEMFRWPNDWSERFAIKLEGKDRIGQLKVAGAFIAAEIDRLQSLKICQ